MTQKTAPLENISPLAGKPAPREMLVDIGRLEREYYACKPDVGDPTQRVHPLARLLKVTRDPQRIFEELSLLFPIRFGQGSCE